MASSAKRKTTAVKLARESRLRERRADTVAKKEARRRAVSQGAEATPEPEPVEEPETDAVT